MHRFWTLMDNRWSNRIQAFNVQLLKFSFFVQYTQLF